LICLCGEVKIMRIMTGALALGTALALCTAAASSKAEARKPPKGPVRVFVVTSDPYWIPDYNIVPRYRYNPRDDRVDTSPNAKPVARVNHLEYGQMGIGQ
jgi:hypothetical protein